MKITLDVAKAVEHSFKDFHARGLDYICLRRSDAFTRKLYILDGDASKIPEVVNPHDHRYRFQTTVIKGAMIDHGWTRHGAQDQPSRLYQAFDYMTPLNGGDGFTYRGDEMIYPRESVELIPGSSPLQTRSNQIHTIQMAADQTVLMLDQFEDDLPTSAPTSCWVREGSPAPDTSGLYDRFTEAGLIARLESAGFEVEVQQ